MNANSEPAPQGPLVSVVTPVYNGERHIRTCIESVLSQTYTHWDYTIVNNCSTDRTSEIAREYAARDSRIRVHENDSFVLVIENHNIAFRQISPLSKYCKVVAADDGMFPECLEKMVRLAEEHPSVAIVAAYGVQGTKVMWQGLPYPSTVVPGHALARSSLLGERYVFGAPTSVLFRSDIVRSRQSFYNESNLHADSEACLEFLEDHDFGFVHQVLTFQGVQEGSLSSYSERLQTYLPWELYKLLQFGPKYLNPGELKSQIRQHLHKYYWYLGKQACRFPGEEFWKFHRQKLASLGHPLNLFRLASYTAGYAAHILFNPVRTATILARRLRRGPSQSDDNYLGIV